VDQRVTDRDQVRDRQHGRELAEHRRRVDDPAAVPAPDQGPRIQELVGDHPATPRWAGRRRDPDVQVTVGNTRR